MIPNIITSIRFITIFPLTYAIYKSGINSIWIFLVFVLIILTDSIDGFIARKYNMVTDFGKAFDPVVDRVLVITTTIALLLRNIIPLYSLFIYIRDIIITIFAFLLQKKTKKIYPANIFGKIKTVFHFLSLAFVLLFRSWNTYSLVLLTISFLTLIPEFIYRYKQYVATPKEVGGN